MQQDTILAKSLHFRILWFQYPIIYDIRDRPRKISSPTDKQDIEVDSQVVSLKLQLFYSAMRLSDALKLYCRRIRVSCVVLAGKTIVRDSIVTVKTFSGYLEEKWKQLELLMNSYSFKCFPSIASVQKRDSDKISGLVVSGSWSPKLCQHAEYLPVSTMLSHKIEGSMTPKQLHRPINLHSPPLEDMTSSGNPGTHFVDKSGLKLTELRFPLLPECWD
ncbi:prohibitin-2-like protein [Cricetulus griseus]|nr:prohibitin-2-like protein [Cricetulus griseus]